MGAGRTAASSTPAVHLPAAPASPPPLSPGYVVSFVSFLLMLIFIVLTLFNFWWLSYWLEQGSGVSAVVGARCDSVGLGGVGRLL